MKVEINNKEREILNFEKEIKNLQLQKEGKLDTDTYVTIMREETNIMEKAMQKFIIEKENKLVDAVNEKTFRMLELEEKVEN